MKTAVKIAVFLALLTALLYWRVVWAWVNSMTPMELAKELMGFSLKWFFLATLTFLAANLPHYLKPWLRLVRKNGRRRYKDSAGQRVSEAAGRRVSGQQAERMALMALAQQNGVGSVRQEPKQKPTVKVEF